MFELINKTNFICGLSPVIDLDGAEVIALIVKATFNIIGSKVQISEEQIPLVSADEYYDKPETSSLKHASDLVPEKRGTDVILTGSAYAPDGKAEIVDVALKAGPLKKTIRIFGHRHWNKFLSSISISKPLPFSKMPLIYENAFGGSDTTHENEKKWSVEQRNPVGKGLITNTSRKDLSEVRLPNLEDPSSIIKYYYDRPKPAGFGFIAPMWDFRAQYAGTYDNAWKENQCPLLPSDFDSRFFNCAHPDLISENFFQGGEPVRIINASQEGILAFNLPNMIINAEFYIDGDVSEKLCNLDTVIIEPDEKRLILTWRTKVRCHRKLKYFNGAKVKSSYRNGHDQ